jgi:hypothetical protein
MHASAHAAATGSGFDLFGLVPAAQVPVFHALLIDLTAIFAVAARVLHQDRARLAAWQSRWCPSWPSR